MLERPQPMLQEEFNMTDWARLRRWFPVLHLLRIWGIAFDWRKMLLGAVALFLATILPWVYPSAEEPPAAYRPGIRGFEWTLVEYLQVSTDRFYQAFRYGNPLTDPQPHQPDILLMPWTSLRQSILLVGRFCSSPWNWQQSRQLLVPAVIAIVMWSFFGIALARMTACEFTTGQRLGVGKAMRYAVEHLGNAIGALSLPGSLALVLWGLAWLCGRFVTVPYLGVASAAAAAFFSLLVTIIIWCLLLSFPLMIASVGVDRCDAFDSFSRSYHYLLNRGISMLLMLLGSLFALNFLFALAGDFSRSVELVVEQAVKVKAETFPAAHQSWVGLIHLFIEGLGISLFWTASTVVYFLTRHSADGMPLDVWWTPKPARAEGELPLMGIAERDAKSVG